jgi:hypothetical protein
MEVTKPSSSQGFPALPGTLVSLHFATTWGPGEGIRDTLVAVVHEHDEGTQRSQTEMLEQVTKVFLYSSYKAVPLLILRTSMYTERQLTTDIQLPVTAGFLHKIEHVQLDTADTRNGVMVVQVRGLTMQKKRILTSDELMWNLPEKACVRCSVSFLEDESVRVICGQLCVNHDQSQGLEEEKDESNFVINNMRICLKQRSDTRTSQFCTESMWLPRSLAATAVGGLNYAKLKLQVLDNGAFHTKDFSIPASVVAMLRVDMTQKSYKDMQNQIQMKVMLMSRVLYLSDEDMSSIRVLVQQSVDNDDLGFALESVFLEVMCANARDVHGGWMQIFLLSIDNKEAKGSLRSSLRAQT